MATLTTQQYETIAIQVYGPDAVKAFKTVAGNDPAVLDNIIQGLGKTALSSSRLPNADRNPSVLSEGNDQLYKALNQGMVAQANAGTASPEYKAALAKIGGQLATAGYDMIASKDPNKLSAGEANVKRGAQLVGGPFVINDSAKNNGKLFDVPAAAPAVPLPDSKVIADAVGPDAYASMKFDKLGEVAAAAAMFRAANTPDAKTATDKFFDTLRADIADPAKSSDPVKSITDLYGEGAGTALTSYLKAIQAVKDHAGDADPTISDLLKTAVDGKWVAVRTEIQKTLDTEVAQNLGTAPSR